MGEAVLSGPCRRTANSPTSVLSFFWGGLHSSSCEDRHHPHSLFVLPNNASVCPESVTELPSVPKPVSLFLLAWTLKRRRLCFVVLFLA